jgi:hypothetical protein
MEASMSNLEHKPKTQTNIILVLLPPIQYVGRTFKTSFFHKPKKQGAAPEV